MGIESTAGTDFDLLMVGAGVSTLYTILNLILNLMNRARGARPLRIGIVEQSADGFGGRPYSSRSSYTSLLITSLRHFLPGVERALFIKWLDENHHWALKPYQQHLGPMSAGWLRTNREAIDRGAWDDLYLPRYLFGMYMDARVRQCVALAESTATCAFELIHGEVTGFIRTGESFEITLAGGGVPLRATSVVLALGSPPNHPRLTLPRLSGDSPAEPVCLVEDAYEPGLTSSLEKIESFLRRTAGPSPEVLLLGASASTMDLLYTLNDRVTRPGQLVRFNVLAPGGKLPDLWEDRAPALAFSPSTLQALADRGHATAEEIYHAAVLDIASGEAAGLTASDTLAPISAAVFALVASLPRAAKKEFATTWGTAIGRLQRRAGPEYLGVAAQLIQQGRLEVIPGRFRGIASITPAGAAVEYESGGRLERLPNRQKVIVNCAGFSKIEHLPEAHLLRRIVARGLAHSTAAGTGIAVNDRMEASDGLFVLGPLLAGNVISGTPVWHLEHCGRISAFSAVLAEILGQRLAARTAVSG